MKMDTNLLELSEAIQKSKNGDEVWDLCFTELKKYGVSSMFYGVIPIKQEAERVGLTQACFFKTNHPKKWIEQFGMESLLDNEISTERMVDDIPRSHFLWHDENEWETASEEQRNQNEIEKSLGMNVGVTLNLANDQDVAIGLGLSMANVSEREFDSHWGKYMEDLLHVSRLMNEYYYNYDPNHLIELTRKERSILEWVLVGYTQIEIAKKMNITYATMEYHSRNIRRKLRSPTLEHAFLKARILKVI